MNPSTDERIASIIRALSEVILPHLPPEASLAQEQTHLAIGQLQILKMQLDMIPAFEREELEDANAIGAALANVLVGGKATDAALTELRTALTGTEVADVRGQTNAIHLAIDLLVRAVSSDGGDEAKAKLSEIILKHENVRAQKDRLWFMPFGFDNPETVGPITLSDAK